jgi:sugar lactone lactonase YvrE
MIIIEQNNLQVFDTTKCKLGEGLLWHEIRQSVFWVDIGRQQIFEKKELNTGLPAHSWQLDTPATALTADAYCASNIWILTRNGLEIFDMATANRRKLGNFSLPKHIRTNDGNPGPQKRYWFGSMNKEPESLTGSIYSVGIEGDYRREWGDIGIPNTFSCSQSSNSIYISDSFIKRTFQFDMESRKLTPFLDFSSGVSTPDGGALDTNGNLWVALWDGFAVKCFSPEGDELASIALPVPRPTNCCFGGTDLDTLFITSARAGLDDDMLEKYPLSGSVFSIKLEASGAPQPNFGDK